MFYRRLTIKTAWLGIFAIACLYSGTSKPNDPLIISGVSEDRRIISQSGQTSNIKFNINQPAKVYLNIFDARDALIKRIGSARELSPGDHDLRWDGTDSEGGKSRSEVYSYTLSATDSAGREVVFDLTDQTGGQNVIIENITYDPGRGVVTYTVPKTARIYLRAGIENGFVVRTLVNGAIRLAGTYREKWDGMDAGGVLSLRNHPKLRFFGEGYQVSRNSIVIEDKTNLVSRPIWGLLPGGSIKRKGAPKPQSLNRHAYHPVGQCRDIELNFELVGRFDRQENGIPIINGEAKFKVSIADEDLLMIEAERSEIVFFLENQLLYENEVSFYPYTWNWDSKGIQAGQYYLTAFVVGFREHFGVATMKIQVTG